MVKPTAKSVLAVLLLAAAVLTTAALLRGAEYDEQYTLFLTAGTARPAWPARVVTAGEVQALQAGHASLAGIARDLRATDVHPPLYFWTVALWRRLVGPGLHAARLLSVGYGLVALAAVAAIARRTGVPAAPAMLLTLGCYGFAYTAAIARGFALAQALTLWGVAVALAAEGRRSRSLAAGALLGAAAFANYLAVFVALAAVSCQRSVPSGDAGCGDAVNGRALPAMRVENHRGAGCLAAGAAPFLAADLWFFLAQRGSRAGQFPPFHLAAALRLLARDAAAALAGGLPLYVWPPAQAAAGAAVAMALLGLGALVAVRWRRIGSGPAARRLLLAGALAPPAGLLGLGALFHTIPIELRYLAFATPFAGLLLAGALASLPPAAGRLGLALVLVLQAASVAGMAARPETMQPAAATAAAAGRFGAGALVLLPRGNDGVGIVGAFAGESPPARRLLLTDAAATLAARIAGEDRVVLALLAEDAASRATLPAMRAALGGPCWRLDGSAFETASYRNICRPAGPAAVTGRSGLGPTSPPPTAPARTAPAPPRRPAPPA